MTPLSFELAIRLGRNQAKRFRYVYYAFLFGLRSKFKKKTRLFIFQRKFRAGRSEGRAWACARWPALSGAVGGVRRGGRRYGLEGKMARGVSGWTLFVRPGTAPRPSPSSKKASNKDGRHKNALLSSKTASHEDGRQKKRLRSTKKGQNEDGRCLQGAGGFVALALAVHLLRSETTQGCPRGYAPSSFYNTWLSASLALRLRYICQVL